MADPHVPPALNGMINLIIGNEWPNASPSRLRRLGDDYVAITNDLADASAVVAKAIKSVSEVGQSPAVETALNYVAQINGGDDPILTALFKQNSDIRGAAYDTALEYEYAQITLIEMAAWLLWMTLKLLYLSAVTGNPAPAAEIPVVTRLVQELAAQVLKRLVLSVIRSVAFMVGVDVLAQAIQMYVLKTRKTWDTKKTEHAAGVGALGGALDFALGSLHLIPVGEKASSTYVKGLDTELTTYSSLQMSVVKGSLGGGFTQLTWNKIEGQPDGPKSVLGAFTSGGIMGALGHRIE